MHVLYANQQDDLDPMNGTVIDGVKLAELLDGRRKKPPFLARLSGENGFELMIGIGGNVGCAQYSRSDGELPYLMADPQIRQSRAEGLSSSLPILRRHSGASNSTVW